MKRPVLARTVVSSIGIAALVASAGSAAAGVTITLMPTSPVTIVVGGSVRVDVMMQFTGLTPTPTDGVGAATALLDVVLGAQPSMGVISLSPFENAFTFINPITGLRSLRHVSDAQPISVAAGNVIDHNADNIVDGRDLVAFTTDYNAAAAGGTSLVADFDNDGNVTPDDLGEYITALYTLRGAGPTPVPGLLDIAIFSSDRPPFLAQGSTMSTAVVIGSITVNASALVPIGSTITLDVNPLSSSSTSPLGRAAGLNRGGDLIGDSITFTVVIPAPPAAGALMLAGLFARRARRARV